MILNFRRVLTAVFLLGKSPGISVLLYADVSTIALEDGTDREFRSVGIQ